MKLSDPEGVAAALLRSRWLLPAAFVAMFGLLALVSLPFWANRFALRAVSRSVEITASVAANHPIGLALPAGTVLRIDHAKLDDLPPDLADLVASPNWIKVAADNAVLDRIDLAAGSALTFAIAQDGSPDLQVAGDGSITVTLSGALQQLDDKGTARPLGTAARGFGWQIAAAAGPDPLRLVLAGAAAATGIALYDQPTRGLRFSRPSADPTDKRPPFRSELLSGTLQVLDTDQTETLQPRQLLWMKQVDAMVERLEWKSGGIAVDVSGQARTIGLGPPRPNDPSQPDRDLTPSLFGYLLGQHQMKLEWGAAIAVLMALWKARQWALGWGK